MMDYCAMESTRNEPVEVCEREMTTSEILKKIRGELVETSAVLSQIKVAVDGEAFIGMEKDEPKCLHDEMKLTERIAMDCMELAHLIHDKLFC